MISSHSIDSLTVEHDRTPYAGARFVTIPDYFFQ